MSVAINNVDFGLCVKAEGFCRSCHLRINALHTKFVVLKQRIIPTLSTDEIAPCLKHVKLEFTGNYTNFLDFRFQDFSDFRDFKYDFKKSVQDLATLGDPSIQIAFKIYQACIFCM